MPDEPTCCPRCSGALVFPDHGERKDGARVRGTPWCSVCEWNLDAFDPRPYRPSGRLTRRSHRKAFALDTQLLAEVTAGRPRERRLSASGRVLYGLSVILFVIDLGLLAAGVLLIDAWNAVFVLVGLVCVGLAVELRPRFGRLPKHHVGLTRDAAPATYRLVDEVAAAVGAHQVDRIVLVDEMNAWCNRIGLRRRRVLALGLPMWGALSDQGRVALLGHELGHFVNGDPTRSLLGQPAATTFARLANLTRPGRASRRFGRSSSEALANVSDVITRYLIMLPLSRLFTLLDYGVSTIVARDSMRAEYLADSIAFDVGGPSGGVELAEVLTLAPAIVSALRSASFRTKDAAEWRTASAAARVAYADRLRVEEQRSIRYDASLLASHPPSGLRLRAMRAWSDLRVAERPAISVPADDAIVTKEMNRVARDLTRV